MIEHLLIAAAIIALLLFYPRRRRRQIDGDTGRSLRYLRLHDQHTRAGNHDARD